MKKIAIMTWYDYNNYGSKLQATATMEWLLKNEYKPIFINYKPRGLIYTDKKEKKDYYLKKIKSRIFDKTISNNKFLLFSKKFFSETPICDSYVDLYQLNEEYDAFICGSDQIWSPFNFDPRYFLDFAEKNKIIAYAPSIGAHEIVSKPIQKEMKKLIDRFEFLSVREKTGANIIKKICKREPIIVADPTLLLDNKGWSKYENKLLDNELKNQKYILSYFLGPSQKYIREIEKYAKEKNLKIYNIPVFRKREINKYNYPKEIGPSEFLSLIKNAKVVFTDSFHGIAFSVNYNIQFFAYKRFNNKSNINQNSRVIDFLDNLSLEDRLIDEKKTIKNEMINYKKINDRVEEIRKKSSDFLKESLKEITERKKEIKKETGRDLTKYCSGCGACASVCPVEAISIKTNDEGFQSCTFDNEKCIKCGLCVKVCPMKRVKATNIRECKEFCSFKSKDYNTLISSSSGGAGHTMASFLNRKGYYVCGCSYNNNKDVAEHIIIQPNKEELFKIQGSKYLQSFCVEGIKKSIRLAQNSNLVFIGTPCQIAGVDKIAKEKNIRNKMILIELICHGVPTYLLWKKYLDERFKQKPASKKNHYIIMRDGKLSAKRKYIIKILDENKHIIYKNTQEKDLFYSFFNEGTCLNKSCFECPYRTKSAADIRIGDYWGEKFKNDTTGISMVTVMSDSGLKLINEIKNEDKAEIIEQDIDDYFKGQYPVNKSIPLYRDELIEKFKNEDIPLTTIKREYITYQKTINFLYNIKNKLKK